MVHVFMGTQPNLNIGDPPKNMFKFSIKKRKKDPRQAAVHRRGLASPHGRAPACLLPISRLIQQRQVAEAQKVPGGCQLPSTQLSDLRLCVMVGKALITHMRGISFLEPAVLTWSLS